MQIIVENNTNSVQLGKCKVYTMRLYLYDCTAGLNEHTYTRAYKYRKHSIVPDTYYCKTKRFYANFSTKIVRICLKLSILRRNVGATFWFYNNRCPAQAGISGCWYFSAQSFLQQFLRTLKCAYVNNKIYVFNVFLYQILKIQSKSICHSVPYELSII
jgi:hypothetical protein